MRCPGCDGEGGSVHRTAGGGSNWQRYTLHCTALHCIALHCIALRCTALHCTALHCTVEKSTLHCTALHCTALHSGEKHRRGGGSNRQETAAPLELLLLLLLRSVATVATVATVAAAVAIVAIVATAVELSFFCRCTAQQLDCLAPVNSYTTLHWLRRYKWPDMFSSQVSDCFTALPCISFKLICTTLQSFDWFSWHEHWHRTVHCSSRQFTQWCAALLSLPSHNPVLTFRRMRCIPLTTQLTGAIEWNDAALYSSCTEVPTDAQTFIGVAWSAVLIAFWHFAWCNISQAICTKCQPVHIHSLHWLQLALSDAVFIALLAFQMQPSIQYMLLLPHTTNSLLCHCLVQLAFNALAMKMYQSLLIVLQSIQKHRITLSTQYHGAILDFKGLNYWCQWADWTNNCLYLLFPSHCLNLAALVLAWENCQLAATAHTKGATTIGGGGKGGFLTPHHPCERMGKSTNMDSRTKLQCAALN